VQSLGNTEWLLNRAANKPIIAQSVSVLGSPSVSARDLVVPALNGIRLIPSWVMLTMLLVATTAICGTAIMRSRAELRASSSQLHSVQSEIQSLREANQVLQRDILRLTRDPSAIELAARERLGMVKANDIVVTTDSISSSRRLSNVSFVR
jgi:cell division protein FtsB